MVFKLLGVYFFGLFLENGLNEDSSVLELVTLGGKVEFVVKSPVNLLGLSVFPEKSPQNPLSSDPEYFCRHSAFDGTSAFTSSTVVALAFSLEMESGSGARVDYLFALHDEAVLDEFADEDAGICLADLLHFVGIHPHSLLSALQHLACQSLLALQAHHHL